MKQLIVPVVLAAVLTVTGCGATGAESAHTSPAAADKVAPVEKAPSAPDLTGEWKQNNSQSQTDFMTATIADGAIRIDWELASEDITAVYWVGTFEGPANATEPHTWTSLRDSAATDTAILASGDETKEFTYKDGLISFVLSIQGESVTVDLAKI